ncbi:hypothetical protein NK983_34455, partial [Salmonella enterica subsp. enterica serovar Typhimurium]|nr:hypothetical protein [Salmonella enterica subsp. enterica serovar Typhimurium]
MTAKLSRHALAAAIVALLATPALAQEADAPVSAEDEARTLDTLVVTAQRRVERAKDVPVALTTVDTEKLHVLGS